MIGKRNMLIDMSLSPRRPRRGFTMIELLVVIGVLIILAAIVLVGMRSVTGRGKEQSTRLTLQQLRNLLGEFEAAGKTGTSDGCADAWRGHRAGSTPRPS